MHLIWSGRGSLNSRSWLLWNCNDSDSCFETLSDISWNTDYAELKFHLTHFRPGGFKWGREKHTLLNITAKFHSWKSDSNGFALPAWHHLDHDDKKSLGNERVKLGPWWWRKQLFNLKHVNTAFEDMPLFLNQDFNIMITGKLMLTTTQNLHLL